AEGGFASLTGTRITRDPEHTAAAADNGWDMGEPPEEGDDEAGELELTIEAEEGPGGEAEEPGEGQGPQDELLLDADRLAEADQPVQPGSRRARMLGQGGAAGGGGEGGGGGGAAGGSTLFERMANLSRAASDNASEEDEEEEEGGSSLRIPRF